MIMASPLTTGTPTNRNWNSAPRRENELTRLPGRPRRGGGLPVPVPLPLTLLLLLLLLPLVSVMRRVSPHHHRGIALAERLRRVSQSGQVAVGGRWEVGEGKTV